MGSLKRKLATGVLMAALLSGCGASGPIYRPVLESDDSAIIYIYRPATSFHRAAPDIPHLYVDDERLLRLKIGGYTWARVKPGNHTITIRNAFLVIIPTYTVAQIQLNTEAGRSYYVRYSKESAGMTFVPGYNTITPVVREKSSLFLIADSVAKEEIRKTRYLSGNDTEQDSKTDSN